MAFATVVVSNVSVNSATQLSAHLDVVGSWGHTLSDDIVADISVVTPAQAVTAIKNKVIAWAATVGGGQQALIASNVWVFGAPQ